MERLTIWERVLLRDLMPDKGSFADLRTAQDLRDLVDLDADELRDWDGVVFSRHTATSKSGVAMADTAREIEIPDRAIKMIEEQLKAQNAKNELTLAYVDLYERFIVKPLEAKDLAAAAANRAPADADGPTT